MNRRRFASGIAALAGAIALAAGAQQRGRSYRVAALFGVGGSAMQHYRAALAERLAKHGLIEGRNLAIDARGATEIFHEDRDQARELLAAGPDAILTCLTRVTQATAAATQTVPIVFVWVENPVASGLVKAYARPGGNVTGVTNRFGELLVKRLELAHELVPGLERVAVIGFRFGLYAENAGPLREAAGRLGVGLLELRIRTGWAEAVETAVAKGAQAVLPFHLHALLPIAGAELIRVALEKRVAVVYGDADAVRAGGLISYGTDLAEDVRRGADLLAKVLRGAEPATLPVDQAARFEMVVNLKTARALGLAVPQAVLIRADRVIE